MHSHNCFITLTYSVDNRPEFSSLRYSDFQLFMKRLRKYFSGSTIRFFMCGEYGSDHHPHYHALLFGLDFPDREFFKTSKSGHRLFRSAILEDLWPHGYSWIGDVSYGSAAYVAGYCQTKFNRDQSFYTVTDDDGVVLGYRVPEFNRQSLKPGIGATWFNKFHRDVFPHDHVIVGGRSVKPPRYYDKRYSVMNPDGFEWVQFTRAEEAARQMYDNTPERRIVKNAVNVAKFSRTQRY